MNDLEILLARLADAKHPPADVNYVAMSTIISNWMDAFRNGDARLPIHKSNDLREAIIKVIRIADKERPSDWMDNYYW